MKSEMKFIDEEIARVNTLYHAATKALLEFEAIVNGIIYQKCREDDVELFIGLQETYNAFGGRVWSRLKELGLIKETEND